MKKYITMHSPTRYNKGITLIELMIVVVIVSILASIAFPTYTEQVRKSKRSEGQAALLDVAQAQERYYARNFSYSNDIQTELGFNANPYETENGNYDITITVPNACTTGVAPNQIHSCFTATATAIGSQASDAKCGTMTINNRGERASANGGTDTTEQCW